VDFKDGAGYKQITVAGISKDYTDSTGAKPIVFKATLSNGLTLYCNSSVNVRVQSNPLARYVDTDPYRATIDIKTLPNATAYNDFQDKLQIRYATNNPTRSNPNPALRKIRKPLIYVEGYDVAGKSGTMFLGNPVGGDLGYNLLDLISNQPTDEKHGEWINLASQQGGNYDFMYDLDNTAGYDLVFVNYNTMRSIQDNALMLQRVIEWANAQKASAGSTEKNVVVGVSMGGLVARYALCQMTRASFNSADTKILITHDSPHQGANVPLGFQHFIFNLAYSKMLGFRIKDLNESINDFLKLNDQPSTQQLLKARIVMDGDECTTVLNTFLNGSNNPYHQMVDLPANQRPWKFVATAQGSQCAVNVFEGSNVTIAQQDTYFAKNFFPFLPTFASQYWLNTKIKSLPTSGTAIILDYKFERRISFLGIGFGWKTMREKHPTNPAGYINWDGSPGGTQDIVSRAAGALTTGLEFSSPWYVAPIVLSWAGLSLSVNDNYRNFSFISTTSSLDAPEGTPQNTVFNYVQNGLGVARVDKFVAQEYYAGVYNKTHTDYTPRNAKWMYEEMQNISHDPNDCRDVCATALSISGPAEGCSGTYSVTAIPGATYVWNVSPSGAIYLTPPPGSNSLSISTYRNTYGEFTVSVNVYTNHGGNQCISGQGSKLIKLGLREPHLAGPFDPVSYNEVFVGHPNVNYYFEAQELSNNYGPFTYTWTLTPPNNDPISLYSGQSPTINFPNIGNYTLSLKKQSATCGSVTVTRTIIILPNYGGLMVEANPNPASTNIEVSYGENDSTSSGTASKSAVFKSPVKVSIYNIQGVKIFQRNDITEKKFRLDVSGIKSGFYILEVVNQKGKRGIKRLLIQR
jgi:hypothetical protein